MKTKENDGKDVELNPVKEERVIEPIRKKISGLDKLKKLTILELMENEITKIENLGHFKQLKQLSLTRNKITDIEAVF
ncbi:hypothetical protein LCGC14_2676380, partial [marine sediment metagenome]